MPAEVIQFVPRDSAMATEAIHAHQVLDTLDVERTDDTGEALSVSGRILALCVAMAKAVDAVAVEGDAANV